MSRTSTAAVDASTTGRVPRDPRGFWRVALAVIAPLPWLALAAENLVVPFPLSAEFDEVMNGVAAHPGAMQAANWLSMVFAFTLLPATIAVAWVARRGAPRLAATAGLLGIVGFSAGLANLPDSDLAALIAVQQGLDPAEVVAIDEAMWTHPAVGMSTLLFLVGGLGLGLILLGGALWRSRVAPAWMGVALMIAGPAHFLLPGNAASAATLMLAAVGYAGASFALLRMTNDDLDLPPLGMTVRS